MRTSNIEHRTLNIEAATTTSLRRWMFALFVLCLTQGCARLSPGIYTPNNPPSIILVRGFQDWYSTGMDQFASELRTDGQNAQAFREEQWRDLADCLATSPNHPLLLIGFSYGADDVILIARRLNENHIPVDLLVTIDPVTPANIPANVKRCVNFYEPNGFWDIFPWLRGVPVTGGENINVRTRPDLNEPDTSHATIAGNQKIHAAIRRLVERGVDPIPVELLHQP